MRFRPYFRLCEEYSHLAVQSASACWHVRHGIIYNILMMDDSGYCMIAGVFYATQICESSYCLHFETNRPLGPSFIISALKKGLKIFVDHFDNIFCTISYNRPKLLRVVRLLGFRPITDLSIRGETVCLLKYFKDDGIIL